VSFIRIKRMPLIENEIGGVVCDLVSFIRIKRMPLIENEIGGVVCDLVSFIRIKRMPLIENEIGGDYDLVVEEGQISSYSLSSAVNMNVEASLEAAVVSASADLKVALSASVSSLSMSYQKVHIAEHLNQPFFIYQMDVQVSTTDGSFFESKSSYSISGHKLPYINQQVPVQPQDDISMRGKTVTLHQPQERKGSYDCRDTTRNVCDELSYNGGCRGCDDYQCPQQRRRRGGQHLFKWGSDPYFGGFELPLGLCVTTYEHWGGCNDVQHGKMCASYDGQALWTWNYHHRSTYWKFELAPGYTCNYLMSNMSVDNDSAGNFTTAGNFTVV